MRQTGPEGFPHGWRSERSESAFVEDYDKSRGRAEKGGLAKVWEAAKSGERKNVALRTTIAAPPFFEAAVSRQAAPTCVILSRAQAATAHCMQASRGGTAGAVAVALRKKCTVRLVSFHCLEEDGETTAAQVQNRFLPGAGARALSASSPQDCVITSALCNDNDDDCAPGDFCRLLRSFSSSS
uniref:ACR domain-containing protein n=1 Tax=Steinernema glaseri TaxID=37863 RepID=A0A1I7ZH94_9BILA